MHLLLILCCLVRVFAGYHADAGDYVNALLSKQVQTFYEKVQMLKYGSFTMNNRFGEGVCGYISNAMILGENSTKSLRQKKYSLRQYHTHLAKRGYVHGETPYAPVLFTTAKTHEYLRQYGANGVNSTFVYRTVIDTANATCTTQCQPLVTKPQAAVVIDEYLREISRQLQTTTTLRRGEYRTLISGCNSDTTGNCGSGHAVVLIFDLNLGIAVMDPNYGIYVSDTYAENNPELVEKYHQLRAVTGGLFQTQEIGASIGQTMTQIFDRTGDAFRRYNTGIYVNIDVGVILPQRITPTSILDMEAFGADIIRYQLMNNSPTLLETEHAHQTYFFP